MTVVILVVLFTGWVTHWLIVAVPAAFVTWVAWVLVNPFKDCGVCSGRGRHGLSSKKTYGWCWNPRCQKGTVQRFGSRAVASAVQAFIGWRRGQ
jgi:hypothetical protein